MTHGSTRLLAGELPIGDATVARACRRYGVQPWRRETSEFSTDPELEATVRDVVGLYLEPPEDAVVLCAKHADIEAWLAKHPRVTLHFTPTFGSWLDLVEVFFGIITRQAIRRGSFESVPQLVTAIGTFNRRLERALPPVRRDQDRGPDPAPRDPSTIFGRGTPAPCWTPAAGSLWSGVVGGDAIGPCAAYRWPSVGRGNTSPTDPRWSWPPVAGADGCPPPARSELAREGRPVATRPTTVAGADVWP